MNFQQYLDIRKNDLDEAVARQVSLTAGVLSPLSIETLQPALEGGKKIRGTLLCLVNDAQKSSSRNTLLKAAVIELIHAASLIHDDYIDQHRTRRNMEALWTITGSRNAVLLGDVIFASAIETMSGIGREEVRLVSGTIASIAGGALLELTDPDKIVEDIFSDRWPQDIYKRIIKMKTGALFGAACQLGAIGGHVDESRQKQWFEYGMRIGEAYQIADDIHDIKAALLSDIIPPDTILNLVPPLLHFVKEIQPLMQTLLGERPVEVKDSFKQYLRLAINRMEKQIETILHYAVSEEGLFSEVPFGDLARRAPRDILALFA